MQLTYWVTPRPLSLLVVFAILSAVVMEMGLSAQDVGWPADAMGMPYALFQHCLPPAKVLGKPLSARFTANLSGTGIAATFERDAAGNTRTELGHGPGGTPQVVMLWVPEGRIERLVDYHSRSIATLKMPVSVRSDSWTFIGLDSEWTDVRQGIAGHDSRKVLLKPRKEGPIRATGECWVSESLMLVMWERVEYPDERLNEWKILEVAETAPPRDILALPPDFKER